MNTFGCNPEMMLRVAATRNAEDIARAERSRMMRGESRQRRHVGGRWITAARTWAYHSRAFPGV